MGSAIGSVGASSERLARNRRCAKAQCPAGPLDSANGRRHKLLPVKFTTCGLPRALSLMWSVPLADVCRGSPTVIIQAFPASKLPSQVFC
jgi:hypothetical protein